MPPQELIPSTAALVLYTLAGVGVWLSTKILRRAVTWPGRFHTWIMKPYAPHDPDLVGRILVLYDEANDGKWTYNTRPHYGAWFVCTPAKIVLGLESDGDLSYVVGPHIVFPSSMHSDDKYYVRVKGAEAYKRLLQKYQTRCLTDALTPKA